MSVPGQTMGMAVFTDPLMDAFDLSRTQLSTAYFFGTVGSAFFLTRGGRWFDRFGARTVIVGASLALGSALVFISLIDFAALPLAAATGAAVGWFSFPLIMLGYFGVRFAGQGILTSASRNVLLLWFERRRGLVSGMRGIFVSLGFSLAPLLLAFMIDGFGWRGALWVLAGVVGVLFAGFALLLVRDTPESCGLLPDGDSAEQAAASPTLRVVDRTLHQAAADPVFWIYSLALAVHSVFITAVTFHIVSVFEEAGRGRVEALGYFFPAAIVSTSVNLLVSWLADRHRLKPFLILMLSAFLVGTLGLYRLDATWGFWLMVLGLGSGGGLWGMLSNLSFVRFFGRRHLGEITGLNTSITVFASAIGPLLFSLGLDLFGSYRPAYALCAFVVAGLLVAAVVIRQPDPQVSS
ncbi:MAG: MFS transporter [Gammaproteobacteria bacterium]|nr:MAG: MFS transporter [Gammaproteobacteria bacterium]